MVARVRLSDMTLYDGASCGSYVRAVEALSGSLMRHNAAVIEVGSDDAAFIHCGLEAARSYFRGKSLSLGKGSRGVYMYWAGRALEDWDSSPPCMADVFRCMGKAARAALFAIASVFNHLLDDTPLPANEVSSSVLVATYSHASLQNGKGAIGGGKPAINGELEKGLLTLISSDSSGLQMQLQEGSGAGANGLPAGFHMCRNIAKSFSCLIPVLVAVLQSKDVFETHPENMWVFVVSTFIYFSAAQRSMPLAAVSGSLSAVSIFSVLLPRSLGPLIFIPWTVIPIIVAYQVHADSIRSACRKLHKIIMDIISGYV
ncbi:hypothetical protein JRO89_XS05G0001900 [Xanthoceras sorbifolium]|uniref:Uncharacterized protein n=1 Tax=Xanthoceras sorbifolium TaxID=99658 RepID=A0ABQ8HZK6_9ROSI|nr:hypothetical protein JRO89_XS05G0001900 [Xanthoceras sorbifolium]